MKVLSTATPLTRFCSNVGRFAKVEMTEADVAVTEGTVVVIAAGAVVLVVVTAKLAKQAGTVSHEKNHISGRIKV
jgi:hypothetical protein